MRYGNMVPEIQPRTDEYRYNMELVKKYGWDWFEKEGQRYRRILRENLLFVKITNLRKEVEGVRCIEYEIERLIGNGEDR